MVPAVFLPLRHGSPQMPGRALDSAPMSAQKRLLRQLDFALLLFFSSSLMKVREMTDMSKGKKSSCRRGSSRPRRRDRWRKQSESCLTVDDIRLSGRLVRCFDRLHLSRGRNAKGDLAVEHAADRFGAAGNSRFQQGARSESPLPANRHGETACLLSNVYTGSEEKRGSRSCVVRQPELGTGRQAKERVGTGQLGA